MHRSDWEALDLALDRALDLEGAEREAFLASLDDAPRAALTPLLRDALRDEDPLLDHPETVLASLKEDLDDGRADGGRMAGGTRIGPYAIEDLVGEGGMGRVFRAHRADGAFDQTVAVKVVRAALALAGTDVSARLRRERDVLASLDHPSIARLLDGGETDDGVPYLVTEFVDGAPITDWADAHALGVEERVRLIVEVARAVDHAHRRFVVHRDLKPSNVLVARRDGRPRPVVLDFGIAKLLDDAEAEEADGVPLTRTGMLMLTPAYAAPELFGPTADVTTAADVYGLGALLYELLTGRRPHDDTGLAGSAPTAEPTRPSKMVSPPEAEVAAGIDTATWARRLRGDLDTICLKALHPDPARRYASAAALADDLTRHLEGRPVEARPDSLAYVAGRFARRHRTSVTAAVFALIALVSGLGVALVALGNEREARAAAEAQTRRAEEAADLLSGLFQMSDPDYDDGRVFTVREAVAEGVRRTRAVESGPLRAYLLRVLGETYINLGEPAIADSLLQAALAIQGEDAVSVEATRVRLALAATRDAFADPERVLVLGQQVYRDHHADADPNAARRALLAVSRAYERLDRPDEAVEAAKRAGALMSPESDVAEQMYPVSLRIGDALSGAGRDAEAVPHYEEAIRWSIQAFGREADNTASAMASLGLARGRLGDTDVAVALLRESIALYVRRYGANQVAYPLSYLGEVQLRAGRFRQAAAALDSAITMAVPIYGPDHPDIGDWLTLCAEACNGFGAYGDAELAARRALAIAEAHAPGPAQGRALTQLGLALRGQGQSREARAALQHALRVFEAPDVPPALDPAEVTAVRAALAAVSEEP